VNYPCEYVYNWYGNVYLEGRQRIEKHMSYLLFTVDLGFQNTVFRDFSICYG
jgi:hypothetical protein